MIGRCLSQRPQSLSELSRTVQLRPQGVPQVAIPVSLDQPGVAAKIAEKKTGLFVPVKDLTVSRVSLVLDQVLNDSTYRDNARHYQKVIAEINGVSKAADLVEQSLGAAAL